jgi:hypothetical protein
MRHSTLVRLAAVSLSVGLVGLVPTRAAAQAAEASAPQQRQQAVGAAPDAPRPLGRRVRIDVTAGAANAAARQPAAPRFTVPLPGPVHGNPRIKQEGIGDPAFAPPVHHRMPILKGDPSIDPNFIKRVP